MDKPGFVYLLRSCHGCKIGKSVNVKNRIRQFNFPYPVTLVHTIRCEAYSLAERMFHKKFRRKRIKGEWFKLTWKEIAFFTSIDDLDATCSAILSEECHKVGIYPPHVFPGTPPFCFIPRKMAQDWKTQGYGNFVDHGTNFRLTVIPESQSETK